MYLVLIIRHFFRHNTLNALLIIDSLLQKFRVTTSWAEDPLKGAYTLPVFTGREHGP